MNQQQYLDELYAIDPSLREHESALLPLLQKLSAAKPSVTIDDHFISTLRQNLMSRTTSVPVPFWSRQFAVFGTAFAVLALVVAVPVTQLLLTNNSGYDISRLSANAFGMLQPSADGGQGGELAVTDSQKLFSSASCIAGTVCEDTGRIMDENYIFPSSRYEYRYDGTLALNEPSGTVYKRDGKVTLSSNASSILAKMNVGTLDLGAFDGMEASYLTLHEADPNGYSISIDFAYGNISINNDGIWAYAETLPALTADNLPTEDAVLTIAEKFLSDYGVDTTNYGSPIINSSYYATLYAQARSGSYVFDSMEVSWPMMVNGLPVVGSSGNGYGITVSVNLRTQTVSWANIINTSSLSASQYELATDSATVLAVVERGGMYGWQPTEAETTYNVTLGEPTPVLTTHSTYDEATRKNIDLLVPALSFPITATEGDLQQSAIVVPLVKEILATNEQPMFKTMEGIAQ